MEFPKYLVMNVKRVSKNQYFEEKNNTIVEFPLNDFSFSHSNKYWLHTCIVHKGEAGSFSYDIYVRSHCEADTWYLLDGESLWMTKVLPEQVAICEAYILVYE